MPIAKKTIRNIRMGDRKLLIGAFISLLREKMRGKQNQLLSSFEVKTIYFAEFVIQNRNDGKIIIFRRN